MHVSALILLALGLVSCTNGETLSPGAVTRADPSPASVVCPVTEPNGSNPPGIRPSPLSHGNGKLWVELWPRRHVWAVEDFVEPNGEIAIKFSVDPRSKRTTHDRGPPNRCSGSACAGGRSQWLRPEGFQATGIYFPTEGCWEITGRVRDASLTFVTRVTRVASYHSDGA